MTRRRTLDMVKMTMIKMIRIKTAKSIGILLWMKFLRSRIVKKIRPIKNQGRSIISISDSESDGELAKMNEFDFLFVEEFSRGNSDWKINNYFSIQKLDELLDLSLKVKLVK